MRLGSCSDFSKIQFPITRKSNSVPIKQLKASVGELTIALYPRMFALHSMPENAGTQGDDGYIILPPWERLLNQVCIII